MRRWEVSPVFAGDGNDLDEFCPDFIVEVRRRGARREGESDAVNNVAQLRHDLLEARRWRLVVDLNKNERDTRRRSAIDFHDVRLLAQGVDHGLGNQRFNASGAGTRKEDLNFREPRRDGGVFLSGHAAHAGIAHHDNSEHYECQVARVRMQQFCDHDPAPAALPSGVASVKTASTKSPGLMRCKPDATTATSLGSVPLTKTSLPRV